MPAILACLKKRDLLHNPNVSLEELKKTGREYLEDGRLADALDFLEKAGDQEGITQIREVSLEQGDPFLLQQTSKALRQPIAEDAWRKVGAKAMEEGRFQQALTVYKALGDEEKLTEIQTLIKA